MTRGEYITELRKKNNYTQDFVADKLGVDRSTISKYEHDASEMSLEIMEDLSKIYNDQLINIIYGDENAYKNIEDNIEKLHYEKHQSELKNIKLKKKLSIQILITIVTSIALILLFFIYYFINTYNSINAYRIEPDIRDSIIIDGSLFITNQELFILIANIKEDKNIKKIELYLNNKIVASKLKSNIITIKDNVESQSYFNFKTIKKDINNLYIKVYTDDETITSKLILKKVYNNVNLFFKDKTYTNSIEKDYLSKIIIDDLEINYHNVDNNTVKFINYDNNDTWTLQLNEKNINYRNKNIGLFQYNLTTNKYIFGKPNDEKLELFFKIYEKYKEIVGIS